MTTTDVNETDVAVETEPRPVFRKRRLVAALVTVALLVVTATAFGSSTPPSVSKPATTTSTDSVVERGPRSVTSPIPGSACRHLAAIVAEALGIDPDDVVPAHEFIELAVRAALIVRTAAAMGDQCSQFTG